jgi:hypothetical protein
MSEAHLGYLLWGLYATWLFAGSCDYVCHRVTHIERTAGPTESWLHLSEFLSLAAGLALALFLRPSSLVLAIVATFVLVHTTLGYVDVAYTDGRRRISPFEQQVHGFMAVLPIAAVVIVAVAHWEEIRDAGWIFQVGGGAVARPTATWLLVSFLVLAGAPIVEELIRTSRRLHHHQVEHDHQRHERDHT